MRAILRFSEQSFVYRSREFLCRRCNYTRRHARRSDFHASTYLPMYTARFKAAHERKDYRFSVWPIDRRRKLVESSPRVDLFGPRFNFAKTIVKSSFALDSHRPEWITRRASRVHPAACCKHFQILISSRLLLNYTLRTPLQSFSILLGLRGHSFNYSFFRLFLPSFPSSPRLFLPTTTLISAPVGHLNIVRTE